MALGEARGAVALEGVHLLVADSKYVYIYIYVYTLLTYYTYIFIYTHIQRMYIYIYIYTYIMCMNIYIYIYTHMCIYSDRLILGRARRAAAAVQVGDSRGRVALVEPNMMII